MGSININISEDIYKQLRKIKKEDQSFSDLLNELIKSKKDIYSTFGALKSQEKISYEEIKKSRRDRNAPF